MVILGIDPGTSLIGYGVIKTNKEGYTTLDYGKFETLKNIKNKDKVLEIFNYFDKIIKGYKPNRIAIESLFFFKNSKTVIKVSEIRGILMLAAAKNGVEINEFTPLQVKQAVSTYGRAGKDQVQRMVKLILNLETEPKPDDIADALALAICCANTLKYEDGI
ncbi:MAG: crossover junction endodeoxyribonuclease RuvC [Candidatus Yanofskybacteria bacterium CG10_big_fil_rev_8_21_14_0_10_36_16]|uniref:Crossover junction endodeoxyribonuclease RuvC n=1 Tax=Candidatus Yanofskybacteria bacterium CG10_big_fil_rev_8_21_14_0_10_36_16 TaxID=1975096 RepID=A0A2J0Q967_9BACT|nr:MAG: crossover junction endodeoxyribonuclease RuvC [Candidatus Yanofskybacteria bacterium CG10_big_fil_rev_8_21_14_0_10_36_16]